MWPNAATLVDNTHWFRMLSMKPIQTLTRRAPELVAAAYAIVSILWILASDQALGFFARSPAVYEMVQTYKGLGFITASSAVLYAALRSAWSQLSASHARTAETERRLADVIRGGEVGTWQLDLRGQVILINDRWAEILGYTRAEIEPVTIGFWNRIVHPDDLVLMQEKQARQFSEGDYTFANEIRLRHKQGDWVWVMSRGRVTEFSERGEPVLMSGVHLDISRRKALEAELHVERNLLRHVMETSVSAIVAFDEAGRIIFANREAEAVLGTPLEHPVGGASHDGSGWRIPGEDGAALRDRMSPYLGAVNQSQVLRDLPVMFRHPQKGRRVLSANVAPVARDGSPVRLVSTFTDVTEQLEIQRALATAAADAQYQALHDAMTGLPNRTLFREYLDAAVLRGGRLALIFIDIDNFKQINDRFGHLVGDNVILDLGKKLAAALPRDSSIARMGGDEFTVLVPLGDTESPDGIVDRLAHEIGRPIPVDGNLFYLTASYGVSVFPDDAANADAAIRNADLAMYTAKAKGRNQWIRFDVSLREQSLQLGIVSQGLQRAIRERRLQLFLQPKVRLAEGGRIVGAEALLRWTDPDLGPMSPARFIPVAESCGLIRDVDHHVLDLLGEVLVRWRGQGLHMPLFINISAASLTSERFADMFLGRLQRLSVPPSGVGIEITEGTLLETGRVTETNLDRLAEAGVTLSVDDFGTGYSSLGYLHRLALSELKIDRGFVAQIGNGRDGAEAIVRAVLAMARALGLQAVAEGVETEFQRDWLIAEGCQQAQGYLFGKPMPVEDFERLLAGQRMTAT